MKKIFLILATILALEGTAWGRFIYYSSRPSGAIDFYDIICSIENLTYKIHAFLDENGGWVIIVLMLLAVFVSFRKKKDKNDKCQNDEN